MQGIFVDMEHVSGSQDLLLLILLLSLFVAVTTFAAAAAATKSSEKKCKRVKSLFLIEVTTQSPKSL